MGAATRRATGPDGWGAQLGPAAVCGAAVALPMAYLANLDAPFTAPKLVLLLVAAALGFGGEALIAAGAAAPAPGGPSPGGAWRTGWPRGLAWALVALVGTTTLSALVARARGAPGAPYAAPEITRLLAVVGIALGAARAVRRPDWRRSLLRSIHGAAGAVSVIGLSQHLQVLPFAIPIISLPGATFGNRNMAAEAVAMALPFGLALLALERRPGRGPRAPGDAAGAPILILVMLALETVYVAITRTRGAWLGGAIGVAVFLALQRPGASRAALAVALALAVVAAVAAVVPGRLTARDALDVKRYQPGQRLLLDAIDPTAPVARTRLGLWRRTLALAARHPIVGVGPGNFVVLFPRVAEPGARADGVLSPSELPRRAHNDLLERLCEDGALGLGALLAVYVVALASGVRRAREGREVARGAPAIPAAAAAAAPDGELAVASAGAASLAALIACGMTGFPLAMPATALLFGVALGAIAGAAPRAIPASPTATLVVRVRRGSAVLAPAIAFVALGGATIASSRSLMASYWIARAEASLNDGGAGAANVGLTRALEALERAERARPGQFRVALLTAHVAAKAGQGERALIAADRALAVEPFSPHAWAARAEAALVAGAPPAAAAAAARALTLLADYPAALDARARAAARLGDRATWRDARARLASLAASGPPLDADARRLLEAEDREPPMGHDGPGVAH